MEAIATYVNKKGEKLSVFHDECAESPRDWSNLGVMVCYHPDYNLGDVELDRNSAAHPLCANCDMYKCDCECERFVPEWLRGARNIHHVYMYEHSGVALSTRKEELWLDPQGWDTSFVGYIFTTDEKIREIYGDDDVPADEEIDRHLKSEIKTYSQYLNGEVYSYEVTKEEPCGCGQLLTEISMDSCAGFYGIEDILEETGFTESDEV